MSWEVVASPRLSPIQGSHGCGTGSGRQGLRSREKGRHILSQSRLDRHAAAFLLFACVCRCSSWGNNNLRCGRGATLPVQLQHACLGQTRSSQGRQGLRVMFDARRGAAWRLQLQCLTQLMQVFSTKAGKPCVSRSAANEHSLLTSPADTPTISACARASAGAELTTGPTTQLAVC